MIRQNPKSGTIILHGAVFGNVFRAGVIAGVLAMALLPGNALARTLAYVDSTGHVEYVDTANPGRFAQPAIKSVILRKAGGVTFNVTYLDVVNHTGHGFDDPTYGTQRQARVADVITYFGTVLNETGVCDIVFQNSETDGSGALAVGGTIFFMTPGLTNGFAFAHITTGVDPSPTVSDIDTTFDFGWPWYSGTGTPSGSQLDLQSVLLHELTHGLGLLSLTDPSGNSLISTNTMSYWDGFLETGNSRDLWSSTGQFLGIPSYLVGGDAGIRYTGSNAVTAYGSKPPIYAPNPFEMGSSIAHWNMGIIGNGVMEPMFSYGEVMRQYAAVEKGALKDIGYKTIGFVFTLLPQGGFKEVGDPLVLNVAATGTVGSVAYQWKKDGANLPGKTTTVYTVASLVLADQGWYSCVVTDQSKAVHETPQAQILVFLAGSLPTTGIVGLCIVGVACLLAGAFVIMRKV